MNRSQSEETYRRACELMPGGVNSAARAFGAVGGAPIVFERGEGAYLFDVDGNRFIDYIGSWGPMILGHAHPRVIESISAATLRGTSFGAPTAAENQLAELIIELVPSVEMVRLVNSGTEATMSAIRLARGCTGRERIIKFAGNYHGHVDSLLVAAGSAAATLSVPDSPGVTRGASQDTIILQYNDCESLKRTLREDNDTIAAVIFEPVVGNMGCVEPSTEFLETLRQETEASGALLIADEVMTGFRVAPGGAQQRFGFDPDLTTLGKIVGGGMPLGAFAGKQRFMKNILPAGDVFQAGTLSGNPIATAAGIATLRQLIDDPPYERLEARSDQLERGLQLAIQESGVTARVQRVGSMMTLFFNDQAVTNWTQADRSDRSRFAKYFWALIEQGIYMPCSQFEALFLSDCHTEQDIEETVSAVSKALGELN